MRRKSIWKRLLTGLLCGVALLTAAPAALAEVKQNWELLIPAGVVEQARIDPAPRIDRLEGKTIALRWNGKNNGDVVLDRLAELLAQKYPSAKIVKMYRDGHALGFQTSTLAEAQQVAKAIKAVNADIVIASQGD